MPMVDQLRALPVSKLILLVTILVALLPISILGYHIYNSAWDNSWREIREKHQLLAQNLAVPLGTYVEDHRVMLSMIAESVNMLQPHNNLKINQLLQHSLDQSRGFKSLIMLDLEGQVKAYSSPGRRFTDKQLALFAEEKCYQSVRSSHEWTVSKMKRHPITNEPTMFMGSGLFNEQKQMVGVILGELRTDLIEDIRRRVKFGKKGHSAIVDPTGHVIAHPNPAWVAEIRDISDWEIVKSMMAGKTGVTKFYSPFMKDNMVAGYASVPGIGWGIMVPQPESEVAEHVNDLMMSHIFWAAVGLILAILLAIGISRWVTGPLNKLALASKELLHNGLSGNFLPHERSRDRRKYASCVPYYAC